MEQGGRIRRSNCPASYRVGIALPSGIGLSVILLGAALMLTACQTPWAKRLSGAVGRSGLAIPGVQPSDDAQISALLNEVHRGMEGQRIYQVLAHVSRDYRDADGRDYVALRDHLADLFKRYRTIQITRVPPRIVVEGIEARAVETFGTLAEPANSNEDPPINIQGQVTVRLVKLDGNWKITEWSNAP